MAKLGKFEINFDKGLSFSWDGGKEHRINLPGKKDEYYDDGLDYSDYTESGDIPDTGYSGRFADRSNSDYDEYDDEYADDEYADEGYEDYDEAYDDADYEDGEYADDYDQQDYNQYDEQYEDDPNYDDRYYDQDANSDEYGGDYSDSGNSILRYVDENDWVTYLLLFLLPPLGIYLLWRRNRFDTPIRYAVSAVSAVWFIVMIILLITWIGSGRDKATGGYMLTPTNTPSVSAGVSPSATNGGLSPTINPSASASVDPMSSPSPTPLGGGLVNPNATTPASQSDSDLVYTTPTGMYYHKTTTCSMIGTGTASRVTIANATARKLTACPECYGGETFYATAGGQYYHVDPTCSGMVNPEIYTKEKAIASGKSACPVCITKTKESLGNDNVRFITSSTTDKSGIKVYRTSGGKHYHMTKNCSGMTGASQTSLKEALLEGKTACPTCCAIGDTMVYCTKNGSFYHNKSNCSGMTGASHVTLAEAMVMGKDKCPKCIGTSSAGEQNENENVSQDGTVYVYATSKGEFYHTKSTCSGMKDAERVTLRSMLAQGRKACPHCCPGADTTVYAHPSGTYYHSYATCSGMTGAKAGTLAQALAYGYKRCPNCWGKAAPESDPDKSISDETADTISVYATKNGKYYHTKSNCSGMSGASKISLRKAIDSGKKACPICAASATNVVYSTNSGKYYHKNATCSNMKGATKKTLAEALMLKQTACPVCFAKDNAEPEIKKVANFKVGTSGIKVYATKTGKSFHAKSDCGGMTGASHITLETALNYGKTACTKCASDAAKTVYATKNGKYYHISKSCAGSGAVSGTLAKALASGYEACPYCVRGAMDQKKVANYKVGTSGIKVFATVNSKYYHAKETCSGKTYPVHITLETAMNYGKLPCPNCCSTAGKIVYAVKGKNYYHASKSCAGSGAASGTYAKALALGLKPCPNCITSDSGVPETEDYSASGSTGVYIDITSDAYYYHKAAKCSSMGVKDGTKVTLQYVKDWGYKKCPYCNPPANISS